MMLRLVREPSRDRVTFGTLFVDDVVECLTLEDQVRERPGVPVAAWKVPRETAIPAGCYRVRLTMSARFGRMLPLLENVPGFSGIRIHSGNFIEDTEGCILVGRRVSGRMIAESRVAFRKLMAALVGADLIGDAILFEIWNPSRRLVDPEIAHDAASVRDGDEQDRRRSVPQSGTNG